MQSAARRAATRPSTRNWAAGRTSAGCWRRPPTTAWRSPWTSPSSAPRTTPGSSSTRLVQLAPGRHHQIRREPAEEVPGHRQCRLLCRRGHSQPVAGAAGHRHRLGRGGGQDLSRGQPPHQAAAVLAVADRRSAPPVPGGDLPRRSLHHPGDDGPPGQGRLHPELHLLHLAQHQERVVQLPGRTQPAAVARLLPPQLLRQHPGHQPAVPA